MVAKGTDIEKSAAPKARSKTPKPRNLQSSDVTQAVAKSSDNAQGSGSYLGLAVLIFLWYTTSVLCNETSKKLVKPADGNPIFDKLTLTLAQLVISSCCGFALTHPAFGLVTYKGIQSKDQLLLTSVLAGVFALGFITLNASFKEMHVSLAMTLRAGEPVCALILAGFFLKSEPFNIKLALSLLPVVIGSGLSAFGVSNATKAPTNAQKGNLILGVGLVMLSNVCFAFRGILTKKIKEQSNPDSYNLFFQLCYLGSAVQTCIIVCVRAFIPDGVLIPSSAMMSRELVVILLNGISFFEYLQLSWAVLARMNVVNHSMCNAMRRPATIFMSLMVNPKPLSFIEGLGMAAACFGSLIYGRVRISIAKEAKKSEPIKAKSS